MSPRSDGTFAMSLDVSHQENKSVPFSTAEVALLAEKSPRAAIVESWIQLSGAVLRALKRKDRPAPTGKHIAPQAIERAIADAGLLE